jgi:hypothetical protein
MTNLKIFCFSILFSCLFINYASAQEKTSPTPTPAITAEVKRFESIQGGFAINIYEAPFQTLEMGTETSKKNGVDFGKLYMFASGKIYFSVMYSDMVEEDGKPLAKPLEEMNSGSRIGLLRKKGTLISEKSIFFGEYPGTEFRYVSVEGIKFVSRNYLVKSRGYQLIAGYGTDEDEKTVLEVLNSFVLLPAKDK